MMRKLLFTFAISLPLLAAAQQKEQPQPKIE